jgi:hypothetical protein
MIIAVTILQNEISRPKFLIKVGGFDNDVNLNFQAAYNSRSTLKMDAASSPKRWWPFSNLDVVVC